MTNAPFQPPGLALDVPAQRGRFPFVDRICAILPGEPRPVAFPELVDLARWIHRRRDGRGLLLRPLVASYSGSDTFKAIAVHWLGPDGAPDYAFTVSIRSGPLAPMLDDSFARQLRESRE